MKNTMLTVFALGVFASAFAERTPWTHQNFQNDPNDFQFAIVPDRAGWSGDGRNAFEDALNKVNLLRPEFVMSVGDLIQSSWVPAERIRQQQDELTNLLSRVVAPFYCVVGNHDITSTAPSRPNGNEISTMVWKEYFGDHTYYSFVYKNVLFLCLNVMEGKFGDRQTDITSAQYAWIRKTLAEHADVRWTMIFMHTPSVWKTSAWEKLEKDSLISRKYTVFAGDWHHYLHARRHGRDYYVLSVAGGVADSRWWERTLKDDPSIDMNALRGPEYGEMDHITWVTMTKDGPVVANLMLSGILPGDYLNQATSKSPSYTQPLDLPENPDAVRRCEENKKLKDQWREEGKAKKAKK